MKNIKLRNSTYQDIARLALDVFESSGTRTEEGDWLVAIHEHDWQRIERIRMIGETDDDVVARILYIVRGNKLV